MSQTAVIFTPGTPSMFLTCDPPWPPTPTKPIFTSGIGGAAKLAPADCGAAAGVPCPAALVMPLTEAPTTAPAT